MERIAILRFENLSGDASVSWQGRALSEILTQQLGAVPSSRLHAFDRALGPHPLSAPGISTESTQAMAAGANRIGYGEYTVRNGRIETRLTIEDPLTLKMVKVVEASAPAGDLLGAATALARQLSTHPAPFGTRSPEALMFFTKASESNDAANTDQALTQATAADPDWASPYHALIQSRLQRQDRAGARAVVGQALARKNFPPLEQARFEVESAELGGDANARLAALEKLSQLDGSDASVWRALAEAATVVHDYPRAMQAWRKTSALAPDDVDLLNNLGYAAARAGELDAAMEALRRYQSLRPNEVNPLDSMGDVNLICGRLAEAESFYLQAQKKDRAFLNDADLMKAALARLLAGDLAGADKLAGQYLEARKAAQDQVVDYRGAMWNWTAGHRQDALRQMEAFATGPGSSPPMRDMASRAWMEISLWNLMLGERDGAAQAAQKALSMASQATAADAIVARFLSLPNASPAEWSARAQQQFPAPAQAGIRNFALAYALLVNREFAAAQMALKPMWEGNMPSPDDGLPYMLAWTYLETGKAKEAAPLLRDYPVLPADAITPYTAFSLPRLFYLRGLLAEKEGRRADAQGQYRKFLDLSGPVPLAWGEEKQARAAL